MPGAAIAGRMTAKPAVRAGAASAAAMAGNAARRVMAVPGRAGQTQLPRPTAPRPRPMPLRRNGFEGDAYTRSLEAERLLQRLRDAGY